MFMLLSAAATLLCLDGCHDNLDDESPIFDGSRHVLLFGHVTIMITCVGFYYEWQNRWKLG